MSNDLFLSLFRNELINNKIFKEIKEINKQNKFTTYNFYDFPITSIIKTKNEIMFNQRLDLFIKYMDSNDIENDKSFNYYIDFNGDDYIQLLNWTNLSVNTFRKYYQLFKNEILSIKFNIFFFEKNRNLIFKNSNIEILSFLKQQFIENKNYELNPTNENYAFGKYETFIVYCEIFLLNRKTPCTSIEFQTFLKLFNGLKISKIQFTMWLEKIENKIQNKSLNLDYFFSSPLFFNSNKSIINIEEIQLPPPPPSPSLSPSSLPLDSIELVIDFFINSINRINKEIISLPIINKQVLEEIKNKPALFFNLINKILESNDLILMKLFLNLFNINETSKVESSERPNLIIEIYGIKILNCTFNKLFSQVNCFLLFSVINMFELFLMVVKTKSNKFLNNLKRENLVSFKINCPKIARFLIENFKGNSIKNNNITKSCPLQFTDSTLSIKENEIFFIESKSILLLDSFKETLSNEILMKFFRNRWIVKPNLMTIDFFGGDLEMVKTYLENCEKRIMYSELIINSFKKRFYNVSDYLLTQAFIPTLENPVNLFTILKFLKSQGNDHNNNNNDDDDDKVIEQSSNLIKRILNSFTIDDFITEPKINDDFYFPETKFQFINDLVKVLPNNPTQRNVFLTNLVGGINNESGSSNFQYYIELITNEFNSLIYNNLIDYKSINKFKYLYGYVKSRFQILNLQFTGIFKLDLQQLIDTGNLDNIKLFSNYDILIILEISLKEHFFSIVGSIIKILEKRIFSFGKNNKFQLKKRIIYDCFKLKSYSIPSNKSIFISGKNNNIKSLLFLIEIGFLKSSCYTTSIIYNRNRNRNNNGELSIFEKQSKRVIGDTFSLDLYYIIYKSIHTLNLKLLEIIISKNQSQYSNIHSKLFTDQNDDYYLKNVDKIINNESIRFDKKTIELMKPLIKILKNKIN
ncbi:hypothetical protein ACTFIW_012190 [Dictyostelium discoideum]